MANFLALRVKAIPYKNVFPLPRYHLLALVGYGLMSWTLLDLGNPLGLSRKLVGHGPDPSLFVWFLQWWPTHWQHPWHTTLLWSPVGVHLGWVTSVPALAIFASFLTALKGPIFSYNFMVWLGLCLTTFSVYLLAHEWHRRPRVAMVQGLIVGISPYLLGQAWDGHLNLVWMVAPLIMALLMVKYWRSQIGLGAMTATFTAAIVIQFFISTEVLATSTFVLTLAVGLTALVPGTRPDTLRVLKSLALSYLLATAILSPWLYHMFQHQPPALHASPVAYAISPVNWVVPTKLTLGGQWFSTTSSFFPGNLGEASGYIGLPWIIILILQLRQRPVRRTWLAPGYALFIIIMVAALGPKLHWYGSTWAWLPESLLTDLPLFRFALPARLMFYAEVVAVLLLTPSLTSMRWSRRLRIGVFGVMAVSLLPNFWMAPGWTEPIQVPVFYHRGVASKLLPHHTTVLVWPYNTSGQSMIWQAESGFAFRMAGGYVAPDAPSPYNTWPFVSQMATLPWQYGPYWESNLRLYLTTNHVTAVLTPKRPPFKVQRLLTIVGLKPSLRAGVEVWSGRSTGHPDGTLEASAISTLSLLKMLVLGVKRYLQQDHRLYALDPKALERYGDLPTYFGSFGPGASRYFVDPFAYLGPGSNTEVAIGTLASTAEVPLLTPFLSQTGTVQVTPIAHSSGPHALVMIRVNIKESTLAKRPPAH